MQAIFKNSLKKLRKHFRSRKNHEFYTENIKFVQWPSFKRKWDQKDLLKNVFLPNYCLFENLANKVSINQINDAFLAIIDSN